MTKPVFVLFYMLINLVFRYARKRWGTKPSRPERTFWQACYLTWRDWNGKEDHGEEKEEACEDREGSRHAGQGAEDPVGRDDPREAPDREAEEILQSLSRWCEKDQETKMNDMSANP